MAEESKVIRTKEEFDSALAEVRLKREQLELRRLERDVERLEMQDQEAGSRAKRHGRDLEALITNGRARIAACNHKKGGKGLEGYRGNGNDNNYAVAKFMLPTGIVAIFCLRCPKVWLPPVRPMQKDFVDQKSFAQAMREFKRDQEDYNVALNFQTDNEMATSGLWTGKTKDGEDFQVAGLREHHKSAQFPMVE